jgi:hypothetical protein
LDNMLTPKQISEYRQKYGLDRPSEMAPQDRLNAFKQRAGVAEPKPVPKSLGGFLSNIVSSGKEAVGDIVDAVKNPVGTVKGVVNLAGGAIRKAVPDKIEEKLMGKDNLNQTQSFDAVVNHYKERYGSMDKLLETAYNDPAGVGLDLSTVLGGAAGAVSKAGKITKATKVAEAGVKLGKVADKVEPISAIVRQGGAKMLEKSGKATESFSKGGTAVTSSLLTKTMKPKDKYLQFGKDPGKTVVEEGIQGKNFDELAELTRGRMKEVGTEIERTLAAHRDKKVDLTPVLSSIEKEIKHALRAGDKDEVRALQEVRDQLRYTYAETPEGAIVIKGKKPSVVSPQRAAELRREIDESIRWTEDAIKGRAMSKRHGVRSELNTLIEKVVPEIKEINQRYGNLKTAHHASVEAADRIRKAYAVSWLEGVSTSTGAAVGLISGQWWPLFGTLATELGLRATRSPRVLTAIAKKFKSLPKAEKMRLMGKALEKHTELLPDINRAAFQTDQVKKVTEEVSP